MLNVDTQILMVISGTVIPLLVAILAKQNASSGVKAVLNAGLSALSGVVGTAITNGGHIELKKAILAIFVVWVTSIATHFGLYKPVGASDGVASATSGFGLG